MRQTLISFVVGMLSLGVLDSGFPFSYQKEYLIISTTDGKVKGYTDLSRDGRQYYAFLGIPYAAPPVMELRFEPPTPPTPWKEVRDASKFGSECFHFDGLVEAAFKGDEDCLYLNVYTPNPNGSLPVMVWIYGGGFVSGSANIYNPKYFMDENVVIVSMNYRLGPLGFLNTGDGIVRGNMGLKDQNMALKWVNKNIHKFGGNPKKITLFGESAGAASVHYHILSPASKGLFQKGIMQSGSALNPWAFTQNPKKQALRLAEKTNCASKKDSQSIVSCLRRRSPKELCTPLLDTMVDSPVYDQMDIFTPSVEAVTVADTFLAETPLASLTKVNFAKVPVIIGVTSGEGGLRTARLEKNERILKSLDEKWDEYIPYLQYYDSSRSDVNEALRKEYFTSTPFSTDYPSVLKNFTVMMSDGHFYHSINKAVKYHSKSAPVYYYYYDYRSSVPSLYSTFKAVDPTDKLHSKILVASSIFKDYFRYYLGYRGPHEYGPCHADDLLQEWRAESLFEIGRRMWGKDYNFSKAFVKMLVDFASRDDEVNFNGIPWPKVDYNREPYQCMKIDNSPMVISEPFTSRLPFWDSLKIRNQR